MMLMCIEYRTQSITRLHCVYLAFQWSYLGSAWGLGWGFSGAAGAFSLAMRPILLPVLAPCGSGRASCFYRVVYMPGVLNTWIKDIKGIVQWTLVNCNVILGPKIKSKYIKRCVSLFLRPGYRRILMWQDIFNGPNEFCCNESPLYIIMQCAHLQSALPGLVLSGDGGGCDL